MRVQAGDARLYELDRVETEDLCKSIRPDLSEEEFTKQWLEFCEEKRRRSLDG